MAISNLLKTLSTGTIALIALVTGGVAQAASLSAFYGDDDGFGVGEIAGNLTDPNTSHQEPGEAPFTDQRLISNDIFYIAPAFTPTGGFSFLMNPGDSITAASLTLRTGAFDSGPDTLDAPNKILLDGLEIASSFINGFSTSDSNQIETRTINLDPSFFSIFTDGFVSLAGTQISEDSGSGSFQIDFLKLDITTEAVKTVPEPTSTLGFLALGAIGAGSMLKRKQQQKA